MEEVTDPFSRYLIDRHERALFLKPNKDILYIHGDFEDILSLPVALVTPNLENMLSAQDSIFFAESVNEALDSDNVIIYRDKTLRKKDHTVRADISFQRIELEELPDPVVLVIFYLKDAAEFEVVETEYSSESNLYKRIRSMEKEMTELRKINRQIEFENLKKVQDLNAGYQQMVISHEELQSTNEELQSVNEELHTVNEELQYKNKELKVANNDINNFLKSTDIGTIFLDSNLKIRKFTPVIRRQFDLLPTDVGRFITTFTHNLPDVDVEILCRRVLNSEKPLQQLVTDTLHHDFLMRILPYRDEGNKTVGIVITFVDLSKTKTLLNKYDKSVRDMAHKFEAIFNNSNAPLIFVKQNGEITSINRDLGAFKADELPGKNLFEVIPEDEAKDLRHSFDTAFSEKSYQSTVLDLKDGSSGEIIHFKINIIPISDEENDEVVGLVNLVAIDTTEETKYMKELEAIRNTFMSFMENAQHQMVLLDKEGMIVYINSDRNSPLTQEQLKGTCIYDQLPAGEVAGYKKSIEEIFAGKSNSRISFNYINEEGVLAPVSVIATPVLHGEKVVYVALVGNPLD